MQQQANRFDRVFWLDSPTHGRYATIGDSADHVRELFHQGFPDLDEEPTVTPGDWDAVADLANRGFGGLVDPCEWEPHVPDGQPYTYLRVKRVKTIGEVCEELARYLSERAGENEGYRGWTQWMDGIEEGLSVCSYIDVDPRDRIKLADAIAAWECERKDLDRGREQEESWVSVLEARVTEKRQVVERLREKCRPLDERSWPIEARIVVFSVRGGNEGDYVHVEALEDGKATLLMSAKSFMGRDAAWTAARRIADLLGV